MKKLLTGIITMGLLLSVGSTTTFAAEAIHGHNFVDSDKDGVYGYHNISCWLAGTDGNVIYHNHGFRGCRVGIKYADNNKDNICNNYGTSAGAKVKSVSGYTDDNQDGICDNYGVNSEAKERNGRRYVDNNQDGVCDNQSSENTKNRNGSQGGYCRGRHGQGKYCR